MKTNKVQIHPATTFIHLLDVRKFIALVVLVGTNHPTHFCAVFFLVQAENSIVISVTHFSVNHFEPFRNRELCILSKKLLSACPSMKMCVTLTSFQWSISEKRTVDPLYCWLCIGNSLGSIFGDSLSSLQKGFWRRQVGGQLKEKGGYIFTNDGVHVKPIPGFKKS